MYYNTTGEPKSQVNLFNDSNSKQDQIVLDIFKKVQRPLGASDVFNEYPIPNTPITSIRRSINTLMIKGYLASTGEKKKGMYGRNELIWKLA